MRLQVCFLRAGKEISHELCPSPLDNFFLHLSSHLAQPLLLPPLLFLLFLLFLLSLQLQVLELPLPFLRLFLESLPLKPFFFLLLIPLLLLLLPVLGSLELRFNFQPEDLILGLLGLPLHVVLGPKINSALVAWKEKVASYQGTGIIAGKVYDVCFHVRQRRATRVYPLFELFQNIVDPLEEEPVLLLCVQLPSDVLVEVGPALLPHLAVVVTAAILSQVGARRSLPELAAIFIAALQRGGLGIFGLVTIRSALPLVLGLLLQFPSVF
mmetsp:Transcript_4459/g.13182  ORF Transcript_4459/g.13182 Transcript_4459/m.13182 type:complete len:268 (-) Transcript_4459:1009-1812(-)